MFITLAPVLISLEQMLGSPADAGLCNIVADSSLHYELKRSELPINNAPLPSKASPAAHEILITPVGGVRLQHSKA